jgi:hypothetical protein
MPPFGFEPTIPASARLQTYALDSVAAGIGPRRVGDKNTNMDLKEIRGWGLELVWLRIGTSGGVLCMR